MSTFFSRGARLNVFTRLPPLPWSLAQAQKPSSLSAVKPRFYGTSSRGRTMPSRLFFATTIAGVGLGLTTLRPSVVHCDSMLLRAPTPRMGPPQPPASKVSLYELSFGAIAGTCAGVFIKKSLKGLAWLLGGVFVLLQYLRSVNVIQVDWGRISSSFENRFYATNTDNDRVPPPLVSIWAQLVDFLTADFQARASFLAGFALGLRLG